MGPVVAVVSVGPVVAVISVGAADSDDVLLTNSSARPIFLASQHIEPRSRRKHNAHAQ